MPDTEQPAKPLSARDRLRLREEGKPVPPPPPLPTLRSVDEAKPTATVVPLPAAPAPKPAAVAPNKAVATKIAAKRAAAAAAEKPAATPIPPALTAALKGAGRDGAPDAAEEGLPIPEVEAPKPKETWVPGTGLTQTGTGNTATEFNPGVGSGGRLVDILTPIYRDLKGPTAFAIFSTLKKFGTEAVGWRTEFGNAMINVVRNRMVHDFMQTSTPWCLFLDDDMLPPLGNASWFWSLTGTQKAIPQRIAERHFLERLLSHKTPLVSATCFGRSPGAKAVFGAAFTDPLTARHARDLAQDRLLKTPWAGTGCLLVHRFVFEGVQKKFPELRMDKAAAGYEWDYFRPATQNGVPVGEDAAFGLRATAAGFTTLVDTGCQVLHIGNCAYGPHNTFG